MLRTVTLSFPWSPTVPLISVFSCPGKCCWTFISHFSDIRKMYEALLLMHPRATLLLFVEDHASPSLDFWLKFLDPSLPICSQSANTARRLPRAGAEFPPTPHPPFPAPPLWFGVEAWNVLYEGHRIGTQSLIMLKIAFNESRFWVLSEAFSLARETFSGSKNFTFADF